MKQAQISPVNLQINWDKIIIKYCYYDDCTQGVSMYGGRWDTIWVISQMSAGRCICKREPLREYSQPTSVRDIKAVWLPLNSRCSTSAPWSGHLRPYLSEWPGFASVCIPINYFFSSGFIQGCKQSKGRSLTIWNVSNSFRIDFFCFLKNTISLYFFYYKTSAIFYCYCYNRIPEFPRDQ